MNRVVRKPALCVYKRQRRISEMSSIKLLASIAKTSLSEFVVSGEVMFSRDKALTDSACSLIAMS